jgi:hypothetical protein
MNKCRICGDEPATNKSGECDGCYSALRDRKMERVRKSRNREVFSEFIRLGQSDLYDWQPVRRALLREIAFLQVNDEQTKVPKHSPFKGRYAGWCYASQRYLAARVGTDEDYVYQCVKTFEKDGVLETRSWTDPMGYPHKEYHVREDVVTAHQRPEDYLEHDRKPARKGGNKAANAGSFKLGNKAATKADRVDSRTQQSPQPYANRVDSREPTEFAAVCQQSSQAFENGCQLGQGGYIQNESTQGVLVSAPGGTGRAQASAAAGAAGLAPAGPVAAHTEEKTKTKGGRAGRHQETPKAKPLPNRLCYPDAFKDCYDAKGKWIVGRRVPQCRKCGGLLHPDENHVCPGYKPKLPFGDAEAHYERMEEQREDMHEQMDGHLDEMRAERMREAWEQEDAAAAADGPPDHLTEDEYLEELEADATF